MDRAEPVKQQLMESAKRLPYVRPASLTTFATYAVPNSCNICQMTAAVMAPGATSRTLSFGGRGDSNGIDGLVDHQLGAEGLEQLDGRLGSGGPPARW